MDALKQIKIAFILLLLMTILTGIIYPLLVTGVGQLIFPREANGSLIYQNNKIIGSALMGQYFTDPQYFWGRPSATQPYPYNAIASAGSNLGPSNPALLKLIKQRIDILRQADPQNNNPIPVDLITASASGLDPDISPLAAFYQVNRVAKARGLPVVQVNHLVQQMIEYPSFYFLGEPKVNVLKLNLALNKLSEGYSK